MLKNNLNVEIRNFLIAVGCLYLLLYFFNLIFRTCSHYPYFIFMENTGLEIKFLRINWFTGAFNRSIKKWATDKLKFLKIWFNIGVFISIILLPLSIIIFLRMTMMMLMGESNDTSNKQWTVEPLIPGVNVPLSDLKYQMISLGLSSIFHELGHALAASREDVQIHGMGFSITYILLYAYVVTNNEQLNLLPTQNKLRILCAGVWHNVILSVIAAGIFLSSSWLWSPLYLQNSGVIVRSTQTNSPLAEPRGLHTNDIIYRINDCPVKNSDDWYSCIVKTMKHPTLGYCVAESVIEELISESINLNCCHNDAKFDGNLCFQYLENYSNNPDDLSACLPARKIIEQSTRLCKTTSDCLVFNSFCLTPNLIHSTKISQLKRMKGNDVLYFGPPSDIYHEVEISNWIPKYSFLSPDLPECIELLCKYTSVLSAGLAVLNIIPCFLFDGEHISVTLIQQFFTSKLSNSKIKDKLAFILTLTGTVLVVSNAIHMLLVRILL